MPEFSPVISSVLPDGTTMPDSTIVAHEVLDLEAEAALVKVHVVARSASCGAGVGAGAGTATGEAATRDTEVTKRPKRVDI